MNNDSGTLFAIVLSFLIAVCLPSINSWFTRPPIKDLNNIYNMDDE